MGHNSEIYRRSFEQASQALAILSSDGRIVAANGSLLSLLGCSLDALLDKEFLSYCAPASKRSAEDDRPVDSSRSRSGEPGEAVARPLDSRHAPSGVFRIPRLPRPGERWEGEIVWNEGSGEGRSFGVTIQNLEREPHGTIGKSHSSPTHSSPLQAGTARLAASNSPSASSGGAWAGGADLFLVIISSGGDAAGGSPRSIQQRKLESLGVLASSIAHDLNNLLTGVLGHVSFLRFAANDGTIDRDSIAAIESGSRRAASLTQKILDFARGQHTETKVLNLSEVTAAGVNLIRAALPQDVTLVTAGLEQPYFVRGDESQLSQVVMNLTVNARDALPEGGTIKIVLSAMPLSDPSRCRKLGVAPGPYALLGIEDDGVGIPAEVMDRMFEPFFTTKSEHGTGLGLAIVSSIVKAHDGAVTVQSAAGAGARFEVYLPLCSSAEISECNGAPEVAAEDALPMGKERILVVDDEEAVRTIIQRSLQHLGYEVVVARNGDEALELYSQRVGAYQLIIIDMIMPRMGGDELFEKLRAIDERVPVLIASGYSSDTRTRSILQNGGLGYIQKPFAVEELAREVRRCLDLPR